VAEFSACGRGNAVGMSDLDPRSRTVFLVSTEITREWDRDG